MQRDETGKFIRGQSQQRRGAARPQQHQRERGQFEVAAEMQPRSTRSSGRARDGGECRTSRGVGLKTAAGVIAGTGIGAALMYLMDPYEGPTRRQRIADAAS